MESAAWATIGVMVTLGGLPRRQIAALDTRLSRQMGALTADVRQVSKCLSHGRFDRGQHPAALPRAHPDTGR